MFHKACLQLLPGQFMRNLTVFFHCEPSCIPLKDQLRKNLKDIRECNNAHEFCGLLLNAKKNIEYSPCVTATDFSLLLPKPRYYYEERFAKNPNNFIYCLEWLINREEPKLTFVNKLFLVLDNVTDRARKESELMSLLLDVYSFSSFNCKWRDSTEYLKAVINYVEHLIRSCGEGKTCPPENLEDLRFALYETALRKAGPLLDIIFEIGRVQLQFSEEEKREFGTLMADAIKPISSFTRVTAVAKRRLYRSLLQRRSSLQFLKDLFAKFPSRKGTLLENFYNDLINNSIYVLDNLITDYCDCEEEKASGSEERSDVEYELSESDGEHTDLEEAGASEMPESHTWWAKCSRIFNKK